MTNSAPKLSICIATFKRGKFIGRTLDSILKQMQPNVEIVIVYGASPDNTSEVMAKYTLNHPEISYFREEENSGVDADFDKAVGYAKGDFCWLMTDDDLLKPDAIKTVLSSLNEEDDLVIVNSEVRNVDLSQVFENQRLKFQTDRVYNSPKNDELFADTAGYLSFIGCVVIRRSFWLSRERAAYYGTLFIHVGVIFQSPSIKNVRVLSEPQIIIRYGNAMWSSRTFEVWMFLWPELVWSFPDFSNQAKRKVCRKEPWRNHKALFHNRALGSYSFSVFKKISEKYISKSEKTVAFILSIFPASLANMIMVLYFSKQVPSAGMALHDLLYSSNAGLLSRFVSRLFIKRRP